MIERHLNYLIQIGNTDQGYVGNNSINWGQSVLGYNIDIDPYLNRKFNRYELFEYCQNQDKNNLNLIIAILSWGGMRRDHGRILLKNQTHVINLVEKLRNNHYTNRSAAFKAFQTERVNGLLPGLGIGYFTKLICFLAPNLNGYIMDQWVAKSINLLTGQKIVKLTSGSWVNDSNDEKTYEAFCSKIDQISIILNCKGFEAEKRLFSIGRGQGKWRNYLISNY